MDPAVPATRDAGVCPSCRRPLTWRGEGGECLRCLFGLALAGDDESEPLAGEPARPGWRYGHFEVLAAEDGSPQVLGAGAMGTTYRAHDTVLNAPVALKVIAGKFADDLETRSRFQREARAAARLRHPHVASVFHYGEQGGECFYAMELVEGETLDERVRRDGPLVPEAALRLATQVAQALAAAEAQGIVHRDLKPGNLMLARGAPGETPSVKVIDFGLAKALTGEEVLGAGDTRGFVGTPAYASPEQFAAERADRAERVDIRSDIYSLGVTLWYALCGRTPFVGETLSETHRRQVAAPLPVGQLRAARVPRPVRALLRAMLAPVPGDRPQNPRELLGRIARCERHIGVARRRRRTLLVVAALLLAVTAAVAALRLQKRAPPERSLAVLPFENLSGDAGNAYYAQGVQEGLNVELARLGSLKVVGTESASKYPPGDRDLTKIGRELGVTHLVEGGVWRGGGRVHISIHLVDVTGAPAPPWSATYDGPLEGIFSLQGEITRAVVRRLQATPRTGETARLPQAPTADLTAYDLYLRARESPPSVADERASREKARRRIALLEGAVARDPRFVLAYCDLATAHDTIVGLRFGAEPGEVRVGDHVRAAGEALAKARQLQPEAGEVHLATAYHAFWVTHDQGQAAREADLARRALPNHAAAEFLYGRVIRLAGRWDEAVQAIEKAVALEPRDTNYRETLAATYGQLRRYEDYDRALAEDIAITPPSELADLALFRALGPLEARADLAPLRAALAVPPPPNDPGGELRTNYELVLKVFEHDAGGLSRLLAAGGERHFLIVGFDYPKAWFEALAARLRGDVDEAQAAFSTARIEVEKSLAEDPENDRQLALLAMVDAALGRREQAVQEGRQACARLPVETQAVSGPTLRCALCVVYAWTGQPDLALADLGVLAGLPAGSNLPNQPTYGDLRLNPLWDSLRGDPRFDALVKRLAPKDGR